MPTEPITITGWEKKIAEHPVGSTLSRSARQRLALKIAKRAAAMQSFDPDDLLRRVLTYLDPTGETAVRHVACAESGHLWRRQSGVGGRSPFLYCARDCGAANVPLGVDAA